MVKKLLNPLVVSGFILVLLLGSIAHLMYGHCQTSKWHYIVQRYYMTDYLPELLWSRFQKLNNSESWYIEDDYSGVWKDYYESGNLELSCNYINSEQFGLEEGWFEDGSKESICNWKNNHVIGLRERWYNNGSSDIKEFYDPRGKFLKREIYINNMLYKTVTP